MEGKKPKTIKIKRNEKQYYTLLIRRRHRSHHLKQTTRIEAARAPPKDYVKKLCKAVRASIGFSVVFTYTLGW